MRTQQILNQKGSEVFTISPRETLQDVVDKLVRHNCGSLLCIDRDKVVGIITERDILRATAAEARPLDSILVQEKMTRNLVTGKPDDDVAAVMGMLTEKRIRHLPILDNDGVLAGMISIGDVVKAQHAQLSEENEYLKSYIHG